MKKNIIKIILIIAIISLFAYGFQEGMEWHKIVSVIVGSILLGVIANLGEFIEKQ